MAWRLRKPTCSPKTGRWSNDHDRLGRNHAGGSGNSIQLGAFHRFVTGQTWRVPCIDDAQFMMVDAQRRVWIAQNNMDWHRIDVRRWAMGSGADYALGAMACGASAQEAVKVASGLDTGTGMGIDCVRF